METQGRKLIVNRLADLAINLPAAAGDARDAIDEINSLRARIEDPRHITLTWERYMELLKYESTLEKLEFKVRKKLKEQRCQKLSSSISQSRSSSSSQSE